MSYKNKPRSEWTPDDHAERNRDTFDAEARKHGYAPRGEIDQAAQKTLDDLVAENKKLQSSHDKLKTENETLRSNYASLEKALEKAEKELKNKAPTT